MVVGTDIAELLLKNRETVGRPSSVLSNISNNQNETNLITETGNMSASVGSLNSVLKEEEVTNKFREYLLYGSGKEALEWAMKHGLWGHALFLASKLDKRTYANVMMRFANGLTLNDPLQTLYQLLSGKMPAAVTVKKGLNKSKLILCEIVCFCSVSLMRNGAIGGHISP